MECLFFDLCGDSSVEITPSGMYERTMLAEKLRFTALPGTDKRHENGFVYGALSSRSKRAYRRKPPDQTVGPARRFNQGGAFRDEP